MSYDPARMIERAKVTASRTVAAMILQGASDRRGWQRFQTWLESEIQLGERPTDGLVALAAAMDKAKELVGDTTKE